ncbi:MAG TPA: 4-(cytidine 5'-diphospho)-2-C-methyl-D-erythritol kinase [Alphaproteobacteria bacterium]|nr:4-(cytidine 5'-diphospho)-2-C-methyl-D-erythritol kinase [Alphaproteobacteria bacterium]
MIAIAAPAKINLALHVIGRRADGYHELDSLVAFASVHDAVRAQSADALTLSIGGPGAASLAALPPDDNMILRAARRLAEIAGIRVPHAALTLDKTLPIASGIGGGSADGAAALLALRDLWRLDMDEARLAEAALSLGADLPVCLGSRPAIMQGIGERLSPAPALPKLGILLVNPRVALPTPNVFRALAGKFGQPMTLDYRVGDAASLLANLRALRNDLQAPAISLAPVVADVLAALEALVGARLARMSGSGATCFALFDTEAAAQDAERAMRAAHEGWWSAAGRLIASRDEIAL